MNELYLSMGSLVERRNGFDTDAAARTIPSLMSRGLIDGAEFMFIGLYYEYGTTFPERLLSEGCVFPTFHTDKDIGTLLSNAGAAYAAGDKDAAAKLRREALDKFRYNCEASSAARSGRLILHLWGGPDSDTHIEYNRDALPEIVGIADEYSLRVLVENVPSVLTDPVCNWHAVSDSFGKIGLVFDTRFATCHDNAKETLTDSVAAPHIEHVHISDYRGGHKDFKCLRPVFHPGEGRADFPLIFDLLSQNGYKGTFTLESPAITGEGPEYDLVRLERSLVFVRESASGLRP